MRVDINIVKYLLISDIKLCTYLTYHNEYVLGPFDKLVNTLLFYIFSLYSIHLILTITSH